ncbi:limonoid UDP-glucosyltransferase [Tripterygium wilfordii]|uniref:Glycosyltransferase n=1 Tax=Tripterygium wilfordii TaxID=458696 RepID=A0A7J7DH69_TRIWF|nr:limonoid UDP-glucosyltransferase-like [Tripterygium wilfordii]KAF5745584.1 limonoid UDP-glucosyltransferase [Tripterygium wilfordii]
MNSQTLVHVLLISFPGQGHVNPLLRLGKRLASQGLLITLSTTQSIGAQMRQATTNNSISDELTVIGDGFIRFEFFEDGWQKDDPRRLDLDQYMTQLNLVGRQVIPQMIKRNADQGLPITCLINNPFIPWVSDVAARLNLPCAMLWVQSCSCFASYYHYHHNLVSFPDENDPETDVQIPSIPLLKHDEIPSFLHPHTPYPFLRRAILAQYKNLDKVFCILMDTVYDLEKDTIDYMSKICPIRTIGPLFISNNNNNNVSGDFIKPDDCIDWLDSKPKSSVVYISFGSIVFLKQEQVDEIAFAIIDSGVSFLWVLRPPPKESGLKVQSLPDGFLEKVGDKGKIVQWSPQEKVLAHESVACFVTHCGWNSSMEALASGVPVVAFPQWGDQVTDAKFLVDVFKVGVRLCRGEAENRVVIRDEVKNCLLDVTLGPEAANFKENALKWKKEAAAAVADGGSSDRNFHYFVDKVKRMSAEILDESTESKMVGAQVKSTS